MDAQLPLLKEAGALVVRTGAPFCCFELSGKPISKADHDIRIVSPKPGSLAWTRGRRKPFPILYLPEETEQYMKDLGKAAAIVMGNKMPTRGPIWLQVHAFMPIPKSWTMRERQDALIGATLPTAKPDWDNIGKILDGLTGVVWTDDAPICEAHVFKKFSDVPGLRVEVREFVPPR